jgi:hypothetical protein
MKTMNAKLDEILADAAPPDPGIKPDGIRDRALRAVLERGPLPEDMEKTGGRRHIGRLIARRSARRRARRRADHEQHREPAI